MMYQSPFMISADIIPGREDALRTLLASMNIKEGVVDARNDLIPFGTLDRLHFARVLIVQDNTAEDARLHDSEPRPSVPALVLAGDCDGPFDTFLAELAVRADAGLRQLFSHCKDFDPDKAILLDWMKERNIQPAANYINWIGRTVKQIHEEEALHQALHTELKRIADSSVDTPPLETYQHLQNFVAQEIAEHRLKLTPPARTPFMWWLKNLLHKIGIPLILLLLAPLFIIILPFFLIRLRMLERADPEILLRPDKASVEKLSIQEDQLVTNPFSAYGAIKPGFFRRNTIVFLLFLLNFSTRHIYNKGYLTRVHSIHFARWVVMDDKHRVLFFSNYDGSLESYMDDFINKVAWGLNLVFSNGIGYPNTRWLLKGGAEHEQKFKNHLRRHQLYTDVWYKAYPDLTGIDLTRNIRIRQGLEHNRFRDTHAIREWLALI